MDNLLNTYHAKFSTQQKYIKLDNNVLCKLFVFSYDITVLLMNTKLDDDVLDKLFVFTCDITLLLLVYINPLHDVMHVLLFSL